MFWYRNWRISQFFKCILCVIHQTRYLLIKSKCVLIVYSNLIFSILLFIFICSTNRIYINQTWQAIHRLLAMSNRNIHSFFFPKYIKLSSVLRKIFNIYNIPHLPNILLAQRLYHFCKLSFAGPNPCAADLLSHSIDFWRSQSVPSPLW